MEVRAYHARLESPLPPRGIVRMADNLTVLELDQIGPAPRGPGADPVIEEFAVGSNGRQLRWRNSGEHPLTRAFESGRITVEQYNAGERLRTICEQLQRSGRDSTDLERISSGGVPTPVSQLQASAIELLLRIERRMGKKDFLICRKFCGEGYEMVEALRAAHVTFNKFRVTSRVCEALDALAGKKKKRKNGRPSIADTLDKLRQLDVAIPPSWFLYLLRAPRFLRIDGK